MAGKTDGVVKLVILGGKGSSLTSSSLYSIATGKSQLRNDSSAIDRLVAADHKNAQETSVTSFKQHFLIDSFTPLETRASLIYLLNKLLYSSSNVRSSIPIFISQTLNSKPDGFDFDDSTEIADKERGLIDKSSAYVYGICAILDHEASCLATVIDAVAALSCEACKADVAAFGSMDSGDGYVDKDAVGVAGDLKVLLNGSVLVGKLRNEVFSKIPKINGRLRETVKSVHSMTRVALNSRDEVYEGDAIPAVLALAVALQKLGKSSLCRAKMNLDVIGDESLKNGLISLFESKCVIEDVLMNAYKLVLNSSFEEDNAKFAHEVHGLLGIVWKIVAWEGITAFVALEGKESISGKGVEAVEVEGKGDKVGKKGEKKKKKKNVLGKGTSVIVQLIKDRLQGKGGDSSDSLQVLEIWVADLLMYFDPKGPEFDDMVQKVKEIVESNESRRLPKLPKGTRDFAKEQMAIRERAFSIIAEVFKRHGATALDTPAFELRETLMGKYGEDSKLVYDLADQGGELCSLRYDLTVPFARYVAMNGITSFKRYQIAKVYRRDNPSKGRYREFYQCDFDIAGQYEEMGPDFEIVKILTELLDELNIGEYKVKLNHRKLLDGMLEICGVPPEKFRTICSSIDKLDKQSFSQVQKEMVEEKGLSVEAAERIDTFVKESGQPKELLSKLKQEGSEFLGNTSTKRAMDELEILFEALEKSKCIDKVVFDLSLARGLDYYTGVIFEAVFKGKTQVGSIAAGGRYDNLIGMFGTKQVPAVGVSLGIERVFTIMEDQNQSTRPTETQVLLSILGDKSKLPLAAELAGELWNSKLKAEYTVSTRFSKHMDRAKESKIPLMVLVGEKELERGIVKIKNLETTVEKEVSRSNFVEEVKLELAKISSASLQM
ncbi:histidine--tRNA ligase, cytoplasmic [Mercurialis annua]|uniref:histidine--tRNA ligase, cytoplasmic n=1 Tax=Mercurialis annua TaxID=3986 RepID=UPI00215E2508|nr:histidine--tRNA ligase, cytoplasmic [Mercurialis annua]